MLDFERRRAFHPQHQRGRFRGASSPIGARPVDLHRLAVGGDFRADDVGPAGEDFGRGEALRLEGVAQGRAQELGKRPGKTARGLAHDDGSLSCHRRRHDRSSPIAAAKESTRACRSRPICWPGTTATAACCPGARAAASEPIPIAVWLSEIMLQQTTVKTVGALLRALPGALADGGRAGREPASTTCCAPGPGSAITPAPATCMPARARWSSATAGFSRTTSKRLRALPGIGDYTAAAIAAIAFDRAAVPVDGNVERVVSRLFAVERSLPAAKPIIKRLATSLLPPRRAGDFAQALMDLGATICSPKRPACALCPWSEVLRRARARRPGDVSAQGAQARRQIAPRRGLRGAARRRPRAAAPRPEKGLLGAMTEVPGSDWAHDFDLAKALDAAPRLRRKRNGGGCPASSRHVFTHFPLELAVFIAPGAARNAGAQGRALGEACRFAGRGLAERHAQGAGACARRRTGAMR